MSLTITLPFAKNASAIPVLLTVIVQLNELPSTTLLLTLLAFVTIRSASERYMVRLVVFDVTPLTEAEAVFVTNAASISAPVMVYVAVQVTLSPGSR